MSLVRSLSRISYLPFVGFVSAYGAYNASVKILNDENAAWNELDVEQALKQNFRCSLLVVILEMAIFFAFFRAGVVYYAWMCLRDNEDIERGIKAGTQMNRSPSAAVATPVSTKDPVAMASPARFSANVRETMPGLQATKDPNAVTAMKSVTATENPGAKKSTGEASSKVITNSSEFSTVKTPTGSPKKDRESPRNTSKMISSSSEFSTVKTTSGSPEKDRESPMNPVAPDLVSKHSKKASKKAGRNEIQSASFKTEAAAVNGDDTENSPRVDLSYKTTAGPEVLNKKKPTLPSRQQLICFVPQPSAQRPAGNKIEPELETALCSPDKQKTSRLQVKVTLYPERKITFADAGSQKEQEQIEWEKTASPSRSRVRPSSIPPRANDRSNMEKYRTLQRSENFATSTTEEVASHGSPTASQVLSAANPVNVSSPRKSKSPLDVPRMNVENVYPMKQIETCKQVDEAADQKKDFPGANKLGIEKMLEGTKKNEVCKQVVFSDTKVGCVRSQSKLTELKKLMFEKKNAINVKSVAKTKTQPDETSVLVDLVQTMDTQEEIKSDADEWKAFLSKETDRPKAPTDVGKQMAPKTSPKTSLNTSPKMSTKTSPKLSPKMSLKTSPKMSPLVSPKISLKTPLNASPKISLKASPKTSLETTPIASPKTSPKTSLMMSLNTSPKTSLKSSPKASPKISPKASPIMSPKTSPTTSLNVPPKTPLKTSPIASPKISPQTSPKTSLIASLKTSPIVSQKTGPKTSPILSPKTSLIASPKTSQKTSLKSSPKVSPKTSTTAPLKTSPMASPKTLSITSLKASTKTSLNTSPKTSPTPSQKTSLKTSPMLSPKTSPMASLKTSPKTSPMSSLKSSPIASPKTSPKTSPIASPKTSPKTSLVVSPKTSPIASPKTSLKTSPMTSPKTPLNTSLKTSPKVSPKTSLKSLRKTTPKTSPISSPKTSLKSSPKASPETSPKMSPKTSPKTSLIASPKTSPISSPKISPTTSLMASLKSSLIVAPKTSPISSPNISPQTSPKTSLIASPMVSPKTSLNTSPVTSPKLSPKTSPKTSLKSSPKASPKTSPMASLKTSPTASPKTSPIVSPKTSPLASPKPSPGRRTGARKSGIPSCRSIGARKRMNDQICPAQQGEIPGQVDEKKEHFKCNQKPGAERISDMEKKNPKRNSQSPSSLGADQSCCSRCEDKDSEKQTVKRRRLPLPSEATPLKLYGPVFCLLQKQMAKRDAAKKAKYRTKLDAIPEEPDEIDTKWDKPRRNFVQEWEEYCKGVFERFAEMDRFYEEREAKRAERMANLVAESENPQLLYEMGFIPQALFLETIKPVVDKVDEKPKERFLKRRERPPKTDPKVLEEIDNLCAEMCIVLSTEGTWSTNPFLAEVSEEEEDEILEWLEKEMNKNSRRSSSSLYSHYNWPI